MGPRSRRSTRSTRCVFAPGGRVRRWLLPGQGWWRIRCGPPRSVWVGGRSWTGSGWTRCCRGSWAGPAVELPQIAAHLDSTVKSNGAADPARPWHPGPPRRTAAPPDTRRWPAVDRPVQRPGDHCAAAPPPDPAAAPTRRHHRPLPHPGPHHRGSCAPRTWTSGWPRCTSSNSPDTPPNRSWTYCTSTASTASRSSAPAATPPGCRRHHHHLR